MVALVFQQTASVHSRLHLQQTIEQTFLFWITPTLLALITFINQMFSPITVKSILSIVWLILGMSIVSGYALLNWAAFSRYFFPGFILVLGAFVASAISVNSMDKSTNVLRNTYLYSFVLLLAINICFLPSIITKSIAVDKWCSFHQLEWVQENKNEAYIVDLGFLLPDVHDNFIHPWTGQDYLNELINENRVTPLWAPVKEYPPGTIGALYSTKSGKLERVLFTGKD